MIVRSGKTEGEKNPGKKREKSGKKTGKKWEKKGNDTGNKVCYINSMKRWVQTEPPYFYEKGE